MIGWPIDHKPSIDKPALAVIPRPSQFGRAYGHVGQLIRYTLRSGAYFSITAPHNVMALISLVAPVVVRKEVPSGSRPPMLNGIFGEIHDVRHCSRETWPRQKFPDQGEVL